MESREEEEELRVNSTTGDENQSALFERRLATSGAVRSPNSRSLNSTEPNTTELNSGELNSALVVHYGQIAQIAGTS